MSIVNSLAHYVDLNTSLPTANMVRVLYGGTIGARVGASRSKQEIREVLTRDIPGWLSLFYLASILQNVMGYGLDKLSKATGNHTLVKGPGDAKKFLHMFNPFTKYKVRSFNDIEALKGLIDDKNLNTLKRNKAIVFAAGIAFTIALLGIFLPWLNVQITRKEMLAKQGNPDNNNDPNQNNNNPIKFSPKVNLTPNPNFKPKPFTYMA